MAVDKLVRIDGNIYVKGCPAHCGSKILEGFDAPFDSHVVKKLKDSGIPFTSQTEMNEFGFMPLLQEKGADQGALPGIVQAVIGGASFGLCSDIYGEVCRQGVRNGLSYIRPTYGTVSRYGLVPIAPSMDQIGILCKNIGEGFKLLSVISGKDENDGAMYPDIGYTYTNTQKQMKIAIPTNLIGYKNINIDKLAQKHTRVDITLKHFEAYKEILYIISCGEAAANLSRYDGIKYGSRADSFTGPDDLTINTRSQYFGINTKLSLIIGQMVLSSGNYARYYEKAMKIRRIIKESLIFNEYDIIALPAPYDGDMYQNMALFALPVLAGLPSITFPIGDGGLTLVAGAKNENDLLTAWGALA